MSTFSKFLPNFYIKLDKKNTILGSIFEGQNTIFGGSAQIITVSHDKLLQYITWGVNLGSTETPKMYYVIYEQPLKRVAQTPLSKKNL